MGRAGRRRPVECPLTLRFDEQQVARPDISYVMNKWERLLEFGGCRKRKYLSPKMMLIEQLDQVLEKLRRTTTTMPVNQLTELISKLLRNRKMPPLLSVLAPRRVTS